MFIKHEGYAYLISKCKGVSLIFNLFFTHHVLASSWFTMLAQHVGLCREHGRVSNNIRSKNSTQGLRHTSLDWSRLHGSILPGRSYSKFISSVKNTFMYSSPIRKSWKLHSSFTILLHRKPLPGSVTETF